MYQSLIGKKVQFTAFRIKKGNPVKGLLIKADDEWGTVILDHEIEGLVNYWEVGQPYTFRLILCTKLEEIKYPTDQDERP